MALDTVISGAAAVAACDAVVDLVDVGGAGTINIYTVGSGKPADPDVAITDQVLLASITCEATAFGAAADTGTSGQATLALGAGKSATAGNTGTAAWFRISSGGGAGIIDGTCGTADADMILDNTSINSGQTVSISSLTYTHPQT